MRDVPLWHRDLVIDAGADASTEADEDALVLPWWHSKLNLTVVILAVAILAAATGWFVGSRDDRPGRDSVDVGFLQDMRTHHEQGVRMASIYLTVAPDGDPYLRDIAREIQFGQAIEIGRMIEMLRGFGAAETNESDTAMRWMNEPVPADRMPGMASDDDIARLIDARGTDADQIFVDLMIVHHEGGLHMAEYAAEHAGAAKVRSLAESIIAGQTGEIDELRRLLAASQT